MDEGVEVLILACCWSLQGVGPCLSGDVAVGLDLEFLELLEEGIEGKEKFVKSSNIAIEHTLIVEQAENVELFISFSYEFFLLQLKDVFKIHLTR